MSLLTVDQLEVRYGPVAAVRGVSFSCDAGEAVALIGPNGAGKSSCLLAIAGGLSSGKVSGEVQFDGTVITRRKPEFIVRQGLALVPEGRRIFAQLTVAENLRLAARASRNQSRAGPAQIYRRFPVLERFAKQHAGLLSGGEQQQLAIARALVSAPRVLLLDEPSLGLAPTLVDEVFGIIADLRDEGTGVVLVEQNGARAMELADTSYAFHTGRVTPVAAGDGSAALVESPFAHSRVRSQ